MPGRYRCVPGDHRPLPKIRAEYDPENFADWFYRRVREWSADNPKGRAYVHHFRKTSLQHSRRGEDINRQVAADARVGESVMMASYVDEEDEEFRARSNRTFRRIAASLPPEVAGRYGYVETETNRLEQQFAGSPGREGLPPGCRTVEPARPERPA